MSGIILALCVIAALRQDRPTIEDKILNGIPLLFVAAFAIAGVGCLAHVVYTYRFRKENCTYLTAAVCIDLDSRMHQDIDSSHCSTVYSPIYEFEYNGEKCTVKNNHYTSYNMAPKIGSVEVMHVHIDENGPKEYYIGNPLVDLIPVLIVGIIFSVPSMIILVIGALAL